MIFVTYGTEEFQYGRMTQIICELSSDDRFKSENFICQMGYSKQDLLLNRENVKIFDFCAYDHFMKFLSDARIVITHGGVGNIITCLQLGKIPLVIPRLKRFREQVDNHQLQITEMFAKQKYIISVENIEYLGVYIDKYDQLCEVSAPYIPETNKISEYINKKYLQ